MNPNGDAVANAVIGEEELVGDDGFTACAIALHAHAGHDVFAGGAITVVTPHAIEGDDVSRLFIAEQRVPTRADADTNSTNQQRHSEDAMK